MEIKGILIHTADQVITLTKQAKAGETVSYIKEGQTCYITAREDIPQYHKMAVGNLRKGQKVYKYGEEIGKASADISSGFWVHIHNLKSSCMTIEE